MKGKLTEASVAKLKCPPDARDVMLFDTQLPGFGVRAFASGQKSYFVKFSIRGKQHKHVLGPAISGAVEIGQGKDRRVVPLVEAKRLEAMEILTAARGGRNLIAAREAEAKQAAEQAAALAARMSLGEAVERYLKSCEGDLSPKWFKEVTRYLQRAWKPLHDVPIDAITKPMIAKQVAELRESLGTTAAHHARVVLSGLYAWALDEEQGHVTLNPTLKEPGRRKKKGRAETGIISRKHFLIEAELGAVWNACDGDDDYPKIMRLLLLTGMRREEAGGLRWSEVIFDKRQIELPAERCKNGLPHLVPLPELAVELLKSIPRRAGRDAVFGNSRSGGGFSGWSACKKRLDVKLGNSVRSWRLHDARRTFSTHMNEHGLAKPHIIDCCLGHVSGEAKKGVAGTYNRAVYLAERRQALDVWADFVLAQATGKPTNIVPIARAS
jgi:integrase